MNSTTRTGRPWAAALQRGITEALNARGAAVGCGPLAWSLHAVDDGWRWLGLDTGRVLLNGHVAADVAAAGAGAVRAGGRESCSSPSAMTRSARGRWSTAVRSTGCT